MKQTPRQELLTRCRSFKDTEASKCLRSYLEAVIEDKKELLVNMGGVTAIETRGFIRGLRAVFKDIDNVLPEDRSRSNPY